MKYIRSFLIMAFAISFSFSLENSLILRSNSGYVAQINPAQCIIQLYKYSSRSMLLITSKGFYTELYQLLNQPHPAEPRYSVLRMGTTHGQPTIPYYSNSKKGIFGFFSKKSPKPGIESFYNRVLKGEDNFWSKKIKYDGIITGDYGDEFILLCIPSLHTLMSFNVKGDKINITNWRNYGPDLSIPNAYNSSPSPTELLKKMPKDIKEQFEKKFKEMEEGLIGNTDAAIELKKSTPWIKNITKNRFVMLDAPNQRILCYEVIGKGVIKLQAVRNLDIDLLLPIDPKIEEKLLRSYNKNIGKKALLKDELLLLLSEETFKKPASNSDISVDASATSNSLILNFQDKYISIMYAFGNGKKWIELLKYNNSRLETAIAVHVSLLNKKAIAAKELKKTSKYASASRASKSAVLKLVQFILEYDPSLCKAVEKDKKIVKKIGDMPEFSKAIDTSKAKHEENIKKAKERAKKLKEIRDRK